MKYPDSRLLVFSKAPDPGRVKTRLIPLLGREGTAVLYAAMLDDCLQRVTAADLCPVELWCSPSVDHPFFQQCRERFGVVLRQQCNGNLGQRMADALGEAVTGGAPAVLIGADCPALKAADIEEALTALSRDDVVVLGPAADGGYYLVGMRKPHLLIFGDMPWGTSRVLEITLERLQRQGIAWRCLAAVRRDLDTPADYTMHAGVADGIKRFARR
jgi:rSAM/selenodomain-associated transferase 1